MAKKGTLNSSKQSGEKARKADWSQTEIAPQSKQCLWLSRENNQSPQTWLQSTWTNPLLGSSSCLRCCPIIMHTSPPHLFFDPKCLSCSVNAVVVSYHLYRALTPQLSYGCFVTQSSGFISFLSNASSSCYSALEAPKSPVPMSLCGCLSCAVWSWHCYQKSKWSCILLH